MTNSHGHFAWYELVTTDVEAAKAFYTTVMGWGAWDASIPGRPYAMFTAGQTPVGGLIELPADARARGVGPSWVGYVRVNDVDAAAGRIERLGGVIHVPPTTVPHVTRFSVFADPETARLALFKWLNPGPEQRADPDAPGRVGWHELLAADCDKALAFYGDLFGWQKAEPGGGATDPYWLFAVGGETIGGMFTKPATIPDPSWLYYFNTSDIDATAQRVTAGGGRILNGPVDVPGGSAVIQCTDPQGAVFALEGRRGRNVVGYFERTGSRDPADAHSRRWSW